VREVLVQQHDHSIGQGLTMADRILRGQVFAEIDSGDRDFWESEEDGNVPVREEEIAEPLEEEPDAKQR